MEDVGIFMDIFMVYILFGILNGHLVHFVVIW
jgi:hypothetical protein